MNCFRYFTRPISIIFSVRNFASHIQADKQHKVILRISDECVNRLKKIASDGVFLRVTVDGGGCSGFQYRFDLDSTINEDDACFEKNGVKIVIDKISLPFLKGSTVDYHQELIRATFRITDNPQADSRCSCGASFAVKTT